MKTLTEEAFKEANLAARLLGDMKHGIYELKTHGGISETERVEALLGFCNQAEDIINNMRRKAEEALSGEQ